MAYLYFVAFEQLKYHNIGPNYLTTLDANGVQIYNNILCSL